MPHCHACRCCALPPLRSSLAPPGRYHKIRRCRFFADIVSLPPPPCCHTLLRQRQDYAICPLDFRVASPLTCHAIAATDTLRCKPFLRLFHAIVDAFAFDFYAAADADIRFDVADTIRLRHYARATPIFLRCCLLFFFSR